LVTYPVAGQVFVNNQTLPTCSAGATTPGAVQSPVAFATPVLQNAGVGTFWFSSASILDIDGVPGNEMIVCGAGCAVYRSNAAGTAFTLIQV
jgi:hypothetical protein